MEALAYILFGFALLQLAVSLANVVFSQKLPENTVETNDLISVLIPARNEEYNIGNLLNDLKNQPFEQIEILVYNDQSTDKTEEIVLDAQKKDSRIRLILSTGLPDGWTGKNHACHSLAEQSSGKYLLFLDADVRISGGIISKSVLMMKKHSLALMSISPKQIMKSRGEEVTVPVMNYVLLTLLPLILVRTVSFPSLSAANGQFILLNASVYKKWEPHKSIRNKRVEDIQIARLLKQKKEKIACLAGVKEIQCRMYHNYSEALDGLSRSVLMFFGNSAFIAIVFWLVSTFGLLLIALLMPLQNFVLFALVLLITRMFVSRSSLQSMWKNVLYGWLQKLNLGIMIGKAIRARSQKSFTWKGRQVTSS